MEAYEPLVSVLIGSFNRELLLERCLDSVFSQSYKNIEVIVVDDASTDNTIQVLETYKRKYPDKFKYLKNKQNKGISYNSNLAYSISKGDYIALIGDDDEWCDKDKIRKQITVFEDDNKLGFVSTYWNDIKDGKVIAKHKPVKSKNIYSQILKGNGIYCGSSVVISRKAWESVKGFDERIKKGTDSDLFRSIIVCGFSTKIISFYSTNVYVDDHIRMTPQDSSASKKIALKANFMALYKFRYQYLKHPKAFGYRLLTIIKLLR